MNLSQEKAHRRLLRQGPAHAEDRQEEVEEEGAAVCDRHNTNTDVCQRQLLALAARGAEPKDERAV